MNVEARITKEWRKRMLLLIAFAVASSCWFFYDGFIGYPKSNERAEEFLLFAEEGRTSEWPEYAFSRGWKREDPGPPKTPGEIRDQKLIGLAGSVLAAAMIAWFVISSRRILRAGEDTITDVNGKQIPMAAVIALDHSKWDKKGIVHAFYNEEGKRKKLVLDDYKYGGAERIIRELESRLKRGSQTPGSAEE